MNNPGLKNKIDTAVSSAEKDGVLIISDNGCMKSIKANFGKGDERIDMLVNKSPEIIIGFYKVNKYASSMRVRGYIEDDIVGECFY
jgi:hypothetical protein